MLGIVLLQPGWSRGQQPPAPDEVEKKAAQAPAPTPIEHLGLKYRFIETYGVAENPSKPQTLIEYMVGASETNLYQEETAQGAPIRKEGTILTRYRERPAAVTKAGDVTDMVRRYEILRSGGSFPLAPTNPPLLEGLSIWFRLRASEPPLILSLTEGRTLREWEHDTIINEMFLPRLKTILPLTPVRVGDSWTISRSAGRSLLGRMVPEEGDFTLDGTLIEVHKSATGTSQDAVIEVSGELELEGDPDGVKPWGAVKARIHFLFEPSAAVAGSEPLTSRKVAAASGLMEARGSISKVQMRRVRSRPIDNNSRLKQTFTRDLVLERRPPKSPSVPLIVPKEAPTPDPANSWVLYDDPEARFHFVHPQYLVPKPGATLNENGVDLVDQDLGKGEDAIRILLPPKGESPQATLDYRNADAMVRKINNYMNEAGTAIVPGHSGWLPAADWEPSGRKVYHHEIAAKLEGPEDGKDRRLYLDYYLVQFQRNVGIAGIRIEVYTRRDDHVTFRRQALTLIRSLALGPSKGSGTTPAAGAAPGTSRAPAPDAVGARPEGEGTSSPPAERSTPPAPPSPPR